MKKIVMICAVIALTSVFVSCSGDHPVHGGQDTAKEHYSQPSNPDTGKVTTTTGDASNTDNSGSGGTRVVRDSSVMKLQKDSSMK